MLRKELKLTQQEFATRLNIGRGTLANYEVGRNEPIDAVINLICREFNVSEIWLRTGEGKMFLTTPDFVMGQLTKEFGLDAFMQGVIAEYLKLNTEQRKVVRDFVRNIAAEAEKAAPAASAPDYEAEARAEAEAYYRQLLLEKKAAAESSASTESASSDEKLA